MYINKKVLARRVGVWTITAVGLNAISIVSPSMAVGLGAGMAAVLLAEKITPDPVFEKPMTVWICPECLPNRFRVASNDPGAVARFRNQHAQIHTINKEIR